MFQLDPQLESDTVLVGCFPLSLLLLSKDANYPWCILVPQREGIREIYQLNAEDRQQLIGMITRKDVITAYNLRRLEHEKMRRAAEVYQEPTGTA